MRALFWILLLVNVILFAVMQRGGLSWGEQPYQAQPALHEEKICLVDKPQGAPVWALPVPVLPTPASAPAAASPTPAAQTAASASATNPPAPAKPAEANKTGSVAAPIQPAAPALAVNPAPAAKPATVDAKRNNQVCLEWGDFSGADLKRAAEVLSSLQLGEKLSQRQIEYNKGYWVYIPPLKSKAAASRKVTQIKALGVKEYFIVQEAGSFRYAISLGVFKTQEAAQNYLKELRTKGVRNAQVGERASKLKTVMFKLSDVDGAVEGKLTAAKKDFPGSELKKVLCTLTK